MSRPNIHLIRARKLARTLAEPRYRRALRHGVAAATEHEAIPFRRDFATIIDVGANRGQFAVFADLAFPSAKIICFEPLSEPLARLRRVMAGRPGFTAFPFALSDERRTANFHVAEAEDSSSLFPIGERQRQSFRGTAERTTTAVQVRRLDEVLQPSDLINPVLLKADVQGGELGVLQGAGDLLEAVDAILVESSFVELYEGQPLVDDIWSFTSAAGFVCRGVWSVTYDARGHCLQADVLFSRREFVPLA